MIYRKLFLYKILFPFEKIPSCKPGHSNTRRRPGGATESDPVRPPGVRIRAVKAQPTEGLTSNSSSNPGEARPCPWGIKSVVSPKLLEGIAPWIRRMKSSGGRFLRSSSAQPCPPARKHSASRMASISWTSRQCLDQRARHSPSQRLGMQSKE